MSAYTRMFASSSSSPHQQHPPKSIVITGGSRGLGYALASCFLAAGDRVLLTSRSEATAQDAAARLSDTHHTTNMVHGAACDVTNWEHVAALAQTALQLLGGRIDVWINNAGVSQRGKVSVVESDPGDLENILDTNLLGSMYGTKAALQVMRQQQEGGGQVWLVDGNGARGNATPGNAAYGASKRALTQLLRSLVAETKGTGCAVHMLSPGMVATDLLFSAATNARSRAFINILAEPPETVAAWLVPRIRAAHGGAKNGQYIKFLTPRGVLWRFLTARSRRGRFLEEGNERGGEGKQS